MADDLQVVPLVVGRARERDEVPRVVTEAGVTHPVTGLAMPGEVGRDDAPAGRGECRTDPPPDLGGRRDAVEQQRRPTVHRSPGEGRERDPGGLDAETFARFGRRERRGYDGRELGRRRHARTVAEAAATARISASRRPEEDPWRT